MQDGCRARLNLISYHKVNGVVFYDIQVLLDGQTLNWTERYSRLKDICKEFPVTFVKFPPKNSIRAAIHTLVDDDRFLSQRFDFMKLYLDAVSNQVQLRFNRGFVELTQRLEKMNPNKAPVIKGRKLQPIAQNKDNLYIVC